MASSPQLMVADGKNLWFYDRDLEQVSVKAATAALTATPAGLLSGDGNIRELFTVAPAGKKDGFDWVLVTPRESDADFREARGSAGFDKTRAQAHGSQGQAGPDGTTRVFQERAQSARGGVGSEIHAAVGRGRHRHADTMNLARVWWTLGVLLVVAAAIVCLMPFPEMPT